MVSPHPTLRTTCCTTRCWAPVLAPTVDVVLKDVSVMLPEGCTWMLRKLLMPDDMGGSGRCV